MRSVEIDKDGNPWFATWRDGVSKFDGKNWHTLKEKDGLVSNLATTIAKDRDNCLWFGTMQGLSIYDGTNWKTITSADGLSDNTIHSIEFDEEGNAWIGTEAGVTVLAYNSF